MYLACWLVIYGVISGTNQSFCIYVHVVLLSLRCGCMIVRENCYNQCGGSSINENEYPHCNASIAHEKTLIMLNLSEILYVISDQGSKTLLKSISVIPSVHPYQSTTSPFSAWPPSPHGKSHPPWSHQLYTHPPS